MIREDILDYVAQGHLAPRDLRRAMALAGALPAAAWRSFTDRLLLWTGTTMLGAARVASLGLPKTYRGLLDLALAVFGLRSVCVTRLPLT
jgi:hypothetical protein